VDERLERVDALSGRIDAHIERHAG